jgi:photosystem II stability/assembly factor-like uncharacterized protein
MGHGSRSPRKTGRTIRLIAAAVAVLCLALPGAALANHSTVPGWYFENPLPVGYRSFSDVAMLGDNAWVSTTDALLLRSADAGRTWSPLVPTDGTSGLSDLHYASTSIAWACRYDVGVVKSIDGGTTWATKLSLPAGSVDDLFILDATHVWAQYHETHTCYRTADGGTSWSSSTPPDDLLDVAFTSATNGWAVANEYPVSSFTTPTSTIYKTTDSGVTWTPVRTTAEEELFAVAAQDATHVVAGGSASPHYTAGPGNRNARTVSTADGGTSWSTVAPLGGLQAAVIDIAFTTTQHGWASVADVATSAGDASAVLETTNGGGSWTSVSAPGVTALACNGVGDFLGVGHTVLSGQDLLGYASDTILGAAAGAAIDRRDQYVLDPTAVIGDLAFVDADHGWALHGGDWQVSRTSNGGASWATANVDVFGSLNALWATSASVAWAVGDFGSMYRSVDAGATWEPVESTTTQALQDIAFVDSSNGWAVGGTRVETTVDGGSTWNPRFPPGDHSWYGVGCATASTVCVAGVDNDGPSGCIMRTTDGGANWLQVYTAPTNVPRLTGVTFVSENEGWAWGLSASLYHTVNGGASWAAVGFGSIFVPAEMSLGVTVHRVAFRTALEGFAVVELRPIDGESTHVLVSTIDGGATWSRLEIGTAGRRTLRGLAISGTRVWVGGAKGTLISNFNADSAAPVTTSSYDGRWTNQPVSPTLTGFDAGAGVAFTRFSWLGAPWVYGTTPPTVPAPAGDHANDGAWPLVYQSVDKLAQAETAKTQLIKIDTRVPHGANVTATPALVGDRYSGPDFSLRWSGLDRGAPLAVAAKTSVNAVDAVGDVVYIADGTLLRIVDLSAPMAPEELGAVDLGVTPTDVKVAGDFAYLVAGEDLLIAYIARTDRPEVIGAARLKGLGTQVAVTSDMAYVALGEAGVAIVDVHDPEAPEQIGALEEAAAPAVDVALERDVLCVATDRLALTFNIVRPDRPEELGGVELASPAKAVAVSGPTVCVAAGYTQYVLELDGAGRPSLVDDRWFPYECHDVTISGVLLHLVSQSGFLALDITEPGATTFAGAFAMPVEPPMAVDAAGEYAYIADGTGGLQIMKAMPIEAASYVLDVDGQFTEPDETPEPDARTVSFTGVAEGAKQFRVKTRDQAGNWNAFVSYPFTVDATAPTVTTNADGLWHQSFTLNLSPSDALSGVASTQLSVDGGVWKTATSATLSTWKRGGGSGERTVGYRAFDRVGNAIEESVVVKIDGRAPLTTDDAPKNPLDRWNPPPSALPVTVHLTATDAHSGVASTWCALDGASFTQGTQVTVPAPADGSGDGRHWVAYYSVDNVGNVEYVHWVAVVIDVPGVPSAKARNVRAFPGVKGVLFGEDLVRAAFAPTTRR